MQQVNFTPTSKWRREFALFPVFVDNQIMPRWLGWYKRRLVGQTTTQYDEDLNMTLVKTVTRQCLPD